MMSQLPSPDRRSRMREGSSLDLDLHRSLPQPPRSRSQSPLRRSIHAYSPSSSPSSSPPPLSRNGSIYAHPPLSPSSLGDVKKLNRSSVSYLRNLSEFSEDRLVDQVCGLGISDIQNEEVPGTAGRKRLARGESKKVYTGGKLWVDKQRQVIQTYEYLCHVGEAKQFFSFETNLMIDGLKVVLKRKSLLLYNLKNVFEMASF
jgi:Ras GTPase-activating-like protein IQGAP2/3